MKLPNGYQCWTKLYFDIKRNHLDKNRQVSIVEEDYGSEFDRPLNLNVNDIKSNCLDELFDLQLTEDELLLVKNNLKHKSDNQVNDILYKVDHLISLCH
jgi:hypothetical protein